MKFSIIIPAYNEVKTISDIIVKIKELPLDKEIVVVDDGSSDGTANTIQSYLDSTTKLIINNGNKGKGFSIRKALEIVTGDVIIVQDADNEYDPQDILKLVEPFLSGAVAVFGSRILNPENQMSYFRYYFGGRLLTFITNLIYRSKLTDEPTGYKLLRRDLMQTLDLQSTGFEFCPEVTAKLLRRKIPIVEIPISYNPRSFQEGKKIGWKDGLIAIFILLKYRFQRL